MDLIRYSDSQAQPLPDAANARFMPVMSGDKMVGMHLHLDVRGDTGKREVPGDMLMVVISGEAKVRSGGSIADVKPGDVLRLPGTIQYHIWTADTRLEAVLITLA